MKYLPNINNIKPNVPTASVFDHKEADDDRRTSRLSKASLKKA